jgi:phenylpropionate dioxygenase-like ring-hydroxylating dioxygenase large terminal subunit
MANATSTTTNSRRRHLGVPIPAEGENGVFSESWFPICLSREIPEGEIVGVDFLGGRVVAYRGATGIARVMSAYCAHLGADLSLGDVQGESAPLSFIGNDRPCNARLYFFGRLWG